MSEATRVNSVDPAASRLYALAHAAMATSVAGQSWAWPTIDFSDPEQRRFGDYELLAEIGRGGMGVVYRARQRSLDREVALKFIAAGMADSLQVARFMGEARAAARLVHPNIVPVHEVGSVGDIHYFSMPLIEGESLEARLQRGPMEWSVLLDLVIPVCEAVDYAHRLGLLHLDLKPANILVDVRGEPLVADFGLARHVDESGGVSAQEVSGTPAFMAPEQILIQQYRLTAATDLYALGALIYRALSGVSPHGEGGAEDLIRRALAGRVRPVRELAPQVGADLEAVVARCLELEPKHRYPSVRALMEDLRRLRSGLPVSVRRPGPLERMQRWLAREPRLAVAAGVAFVAIAAGGSIAFAQWREAEAARIQAVIERDAAEAARAAERLERQRAEDTAALGARLYTEHSRFKTTNDVAAEVVRWLRERMPGDEGSQAVVLTRFAEALGSNHARNSVYEVLFAVLEQTGGEYRRRVIDRLREMATPDSMIHAAMLAWRDEQKSEAPGQLGALLSEALTMQPDHAFGWYVASTYCNGVRADRCAVPDAARRLTEADPDNGYAWTVRAMAATDDDAYAALHQASEAPRFEDFFGASYAAYAEAIESAGVPPPPLVAGPARVLAPNASVEETTAQLEAWALPMPQFQRLIDLCHPDRNTRLHEPGVRADCESVGLRLAGVKGGLIHNMIGSAMVRRLNPGTPLAAEMRALRARYVYLSEVQEGLSREQLMSYPNRRLYQDMIELGEMEAMARMAVHFGFSGEPPANWQPKDPTALMLGDEREAYRKQQETHAP